MSAIPLTPRPVLLQPHRCLAAWLERLAPVQSDSRSVGRRVHCFGTCLIVFAFLELGFSLATVVLLSMDGGNDYVAADEYYSARWYIAPVRI